MPRLGGGEGVGRDGKRGVYERGLGGRGVTGKRVGPRGESE